MMKGHSITQWVNYVSYNVPIYKGNAGIILISFIIQEMMMRALGIVGGLIISNIVVVLPLFAQSPKIADLDTSDLSNVIYYYIGDITTQGTSKIDLLYNNQETTNERRGLIKHFCDTFLNTRDDGLE